MHVYLMKYKPITIIIIIIIIIIILKMKQQQQHDIVVSSSIYSLWRLVGRMLDML